MDLLSSYLLESVGIRILKKIEQKIQIPFQVFQGAIQYGPRLFLQNFQIKDKPLE